MVPQLGSHKEPDSAEDVSEHESIEELEPLGWIHTQQMKVKHLTPFAAMMHASRTVESDGRVGWYEGNHNVMCVHTWLLFFGGLPLDRAGHDESTER